VENCKDKDQNLLIECVMILSQHIPKSANELKFLINSKFSEQVTANYLSQANFISNYEINKENVKLQNLES